LFHADETHKKIGAITAEAASNEVLDMVEAKNVYLADMVSPGGGGSVGAWKVGKGDGARGTWGRLWDRARCLG
jgi:hypothetical protein